MNFGLLGDWDAMPDLDDFAAGLQASLAELASAAGVKLHDSPPPPKPQPAHKQRKHVAT
jgi:hypothetical protein